MCVQYDQKIIVNLLEVGWRVVVIQTIMHSHRCAVLHHGVVEFVALGCASREEAALAYVIVEMLQTAIPTIRSVEKRTKRDAKSNFCRAIMLIYKL